MNLAEFYQACDRLIETGWKIPELERLCHFRDSFKQTSLDLPDLNLDIRHLEFIRWLVQTGRITDDCDCFVKVQRKM
ncbi:MAG: hypothetical protein ACXWPS_12560 [Ktedonobacteraceae bacterium]